MDPLNLPLDCKHAHVSQFTSDDFTGTLERHGVTISMDEAPPKWWTPLLSSRWSRKVSNGPGTASIHG